MTYYGLNLFRFSVETLNLQLKIRHSERVTLSAVEVKRGNLMNEVIYPKDCRSRTSFAMTSLF